MLRGTVIHTLRHLPSFLARRLPAVVILIVAAGCDNVDWGGIEMNLRPPPEEAEGLDAGGRAGPDDSLPTLPTGPVLFAGWREEDGVAVTPVAELRGDSVIALDFEDDPSAFRALFVRELVPRGSELTLFSGGTRIGTLLVERGEGADTLRCGSRPVLAGTPELVEGGEAAERFLALPKGTETGASRGVFRAVEADAGVRRSSVNLLAEILSQLGAQWPPSTVEARQDLQAFTLDGSPAFSATFVHRDRMEVGEAPGGAYSLLLLGRMEGEGYGTAHVSYREVAREGKGVPRFWQELDWDGDGDTEILVEVFGAEDRWWAALGREGDGWIRTYSDRCGGSPVPEDGGAAGGSAGG